MRTLLAFLLLVQSVAADVVFYYPTGASLYVRFADASDTAVTLTEGSTLKTGRYVAADAAITSAGLAAGTYTAGVFIGTAGSQSASDVRVGSLTDFRWSGSAETVTSASVAAILDDTGTSGVAVSASSVRTALGMAAADLDTQLAGLENTIGTPVGDSLAADIAAIETDGTLATQIAAKVVAARGQYYPPRALVWVLQRDATSGIIVKDSFIQTKAATETAKRWIDFSSLLGRNEALETLNTCTISGSTFAITSGSTGITGNLVYMTITGGASSGTGTISYSVTTTAGQVLTGTCSIRVP